MRHLKEWSSRGCLGAFGLPVCIGLPVCRSRCRWKGTPWAWVLPARRLGALLLVLGLVSLGFAALSEQPLAGQEPGVAAPASLSLVMIEEEGCGYCRRWLQEVGPGYPLSDEGRKAPLVRIDRMSKDAGRFARVVYTPTFILMRDGKELGRINGYPGPDFFWSMLGDILRKIDTVAPPASALRPRLD